VNIKLEVHTIKELTISESKLKWQDVKFKTMTFQDLKTYFDSVELPRTLRGLYGINYLNVPEYVTKRINFLEVAPVELHQKYLSELINVYKSMQDVDNWNNGITKIEKRIKC
jgi:hypothetical protein